MKEKIIPGIAKLAELEQIIREEKVDEQPVVQKPEDNSAAVITVYRQGNPVVVFPRGIDFRNGGSIPF